MQNMSTRESLSLRNTVCSDPTARQAIENISAEAVAEQANGEITRKETLRQQLLMLKIFKRDGRITRAQFRERREPILRAYQQLIQPDLFKRRKQ